MKVLWLSNKSLFDTRLGETGTWLDALSGILTSRGKIDLRNFCFGDVDVVTKYEREWLSEWVFPKPKLIKNLSNFDPQSRSHLKVAINEFSPDLIHIWGTETLWGQFAKDCQFDSPVLLEMQGLKGAISKVYEGGLSWYDAISCIGLKELLRKNTIFNLKQKYKDWGVIEKNVITANQFIAVQSRWTESQVKAFNKEAVIYYSDRTLRPEFYGTKIWENTSKKIIFCSCAYSSPFKGLHIAVRALSILQKSYPDIELRIAGAHQRDGIRRDGYISWVCKEISRLGLDSNVRWLGPLSASDLVEELVVSSAFVLPSFIESYCLALAESMILGVPSVVGYSGGASWLAKDEETALFFPPGDEEMCAFQIDRVLSDSSLSLQLSDAARKVALKRHDLDSLVERQIKTYQDVIQKHK